MYLDRSPRELDLTAPMEHAFVRDWWLWLPSLPIDGRELFASFDATVTADEILFSMKPVGSSWSLFLERGADPEATSAEAVLGRALDEWSATFPNRGCVIDAAVPARRCTPKR